MQARRGGWRLWRQPAALACAQASSARALRKLKTPGMHAGAAGRLTVVAATSRPHALDPALRRPGRLDREVIVPIPSAAARRAILALHAARLPLAADVDLAR